MTGSGPCSGLFLLAAINFFSAMYIAFPLLHLGQMGHWYIFCMALILQVIVCVSLLLTMFTDPGYLPQQQRAVTWEIRSSKALVHFKGGISKLKYCHTCHIIRPPRTVHCSYCNVCIERMDHHCPWLGCCIGKRNYVVFSVFTHSLTLFSVSCLLVTILHIGLLMAEHQADYSFFRGLLQTFIESPTTGFLLVAAFFTALFTSVLSFYHFRLAFRNETTNEDKK